MCKFWTCQDRRVHAPDLRQVRSAVHAACSSLPIQPRIPFCAGATCNPLNQQEHRFLITLPLFQRARGCHAAPHNHRKPIHHRRPHTHLQHLHHRESQWQTPLHPAAMSSACTTASARRLGTSSRPIGGHTESCLTDTRKQRRQLRRHFRGHQSVEQHPSRNQV